LTSARAFQKEKEREKEKKGYHRAGPASQFLVRARRKGLVLEPEKENLRGEMPFAKGNFY